MQGRVDRVTPQDRVISGHIVDLLRKSDVSRADLADVLGLSNVELNHKLGGTSGWSVDQLYRVAAALVVEPQELLSDLG